VFAVQNHEFFENRLQLRTCSPFLIPRWVSAVKSGIKERMVASIEEENIEPGNIQADLVARGHTHSSREAKTKRSVSIYSKRWSQSSRPKRVWRQFWSQKSSIKNSTQKARGFRA
jgi:hypothetical protein